MARKKLTRAAKTISPYGRRHGVETKLIVDPMEAKPDDLNQRQKLLDQMRQQKNRLKTRLVKR